MRENFSNKVKMDANFSDNNTHKKIFIIVTFSLLLILVAVLFINFNQKSISFGGKAILSLETNYAANESLRGTLSLSMKQGELIPADSIVRVNMAGENYDYKLSDLVGENKVEGNFYAEGKSLTGTGEGYGSAGSATIYPDVDFSMKVISSSEKDKDKNKDKNAESVQEEQTTSDNANATSSEASTTETSAETPTTEITPATETPATEQTTSIETTSTSETATETSKQVKDDKKEESSTTEVSTETPAETTPAETSPITGQVSSKLEREISASVSKNSPYTYNLEEGEAAEIISSSQTVELTIKDSIATITTDYSETGALGFGEDYLGEPTYKLNIDLSLLDLTARDGDMTIELIYGETAITSVSTALNVVGEETYQNVSVQNMTETNMTETNFTKTNITTNITTNLSLQDYRRYNLTEQELFLLKSKTGASEIKITKSEVINDRLVIKFEIGTYWSERSYNPDSADLDAQIELDRIKWVKYLAQKLGEKSPVPEKISKYMGNYSL